MRKFLLPFICITSVCSLASEAQFEPKDMLGSWQVFSPGISDTDINELREALEEGRSAGMEIPHSSMYMMLMGMRLNVSAEKATYGMDQALALETLKFPETSTLAPFQPMMNINWSTDDNEPSSKINFVATVVEDMEQDKLDCSIDYPNANTFQLSCVDGDGNDTEQAVISRIGNGEIQLAPAENGYVNPEEILRLVKIKN